MAGKCAFSTAALSPQRSGDGWILGHFLEIGWTARAMNGGDHPIGFFLLEVLVFGVEQ